MLSKINYIWIVCIALTLFILSCNDQGINRAENKKSTSKELTALPTEQLGTQLRSGDGTLLLNRAMSPTDPMRNPNWDWTRNTRDTLYITSYANLKHILRPYYVAASIKPLFTGTDGTRDI